MKTRCFVTIAILAIMACIFTLMDASPHPNWAVQAAGPAQPSRQGAWLDSLVFSEQADASQAVAQLQADELDVYAQPVADATLFQMVLEDSNLAYTESSGSYDELSFNPYGPTFYDGRLNPFSNAKIREAMNWLIDRNKIAQEIYGGMAVPKWVPIAQIDTDTTRYQSTIQAIETQYAYNFSQAQAAITTEMEGMGAALEGGIWYYNDQPVTVIFIIRVEDQRRPIGDYVSDQLESIGLVVDRQYMTRAQAFPIWQQSDPGEGQWHVYTGGWITTSISRDDGTNFGYFYTPLGNGLPLWQAYNPTPEFYALCESLWVNNFATLDERATLFEQALSMAMNDSGSGSEGAGSVRVWLVDVTGFAPRRLGTLVASDLAGGVQGAEMFPYVARFDGVEGGNLRLSEQALFISPWNPIAGSNAVNDLMPQLATEERGLISDPNTGLYLPLRIENAEVVVKTGLPVTNTLDWVSLTTSDTIEVPGGAWVDWDAASQMFVTASERYTYTLTANSKITVHYPANLFTTVTWHDGSPLSMGDFVMNMIMRFDPYKPESAIYDANRVYDLDAFMSHFKGLVIESTDPLVITTYDDRYTLDAESMVQTWFPGGGSYAFGTAPWQSLTAAIRAEAAGQLAFSADKAGQLGVPWTDFIGGESLAIMESWMNQSAVEHYLPYIPTMSIYVNLNETDSRWAALQTWYAARQHFWLGTGPFYIDQLTYDPKSISLAHFDAYPDAAGRWDAFAAPAQPELSINYSSGAPGSYFNLTGSGFPPDSLASIVANNHILDQLAVDNSGNISFTLSTDQADPGVYHLRVSVNPSAGVQLTLDEGQPVRPREGNLPLVVVPGGLIIRKGAWLDSLVFSEQGNANQAVAQLQSGELDLYAYTVTDPDIYKTVLLDPNLTRTEAYQSYTELTFNPSGPTFVDGRLNPFSNARIREAMNWLVDRQKIAQEIYGGTAAPLYTSILLSSADFGRFQSTIDSLEALYAYNPEQAEATITTEMESMGATLQDGLWYYNDQPVTIIFIIRVEDQRQATGNYVADQLESIGFTVDRQYKTRAQASPIWNQSDPAEGLWHIYTGGWISTAISRDDSANFGFFYTPLGSGSPLWQAYNPTPEFEAICTSLWNNDFTNVDERSAAFEQALAAAMNDSGTGSEGSGSVRVWLVDTFGFAPQRAGITVASDLAGGVASTAMFPYVARFNNMEGGSLRLAQPGLLIEPWNPIAGSSWVYDSFPRLATSDSGIIADPNTGLYWPQRIESAEVTVRTGLPVTKTLDWVTLTTSDTIEVPGGAWVDWDATSQTFITASEKFTYTLMANSKVTVHYPSDLFTTVSWHDGSPISMGDFIMNMIMRFDPYKPESAIYDSNRTYDFDAFMSHFKGLVIESTDPLVITTYDDWYYLDAESMVQTWFPTGGSYAYGTAPWHSLTAAVRAEAAGQLAFSSDKAGQLGVPWTDFIGGESLGILESWMDQSAGEHYIPYTPTMGAYVTQGEADSRWAALQAWYAARQHFWLGTGPFYVEQVLLDPKGLTLARFETYPDAAGRWDAFAALAQPVLAINHDSGAPGSYFNVTGAGFPPNSLATIVANNRILGQLAVDSGGNIAFTLSTDQAFPGVYYLRVSVNPSAAVQFTLDEALPILPREGDLPIIDVPGGLIIRPLFLPLIGRN